MPLPFDRRRFLTGSLTTLALTSLSAHAAERPLVHEPRATSGDRREPTWEEHLTLTVGPDQGDLRGDNEKVIQAAVDAVARQGGGTVQLLPGTFRLRNAVYLASHVRLRGRGAATVLAKEPSFSSKLVQDSDWFDQEITLADARAFRLGDGICLRARNPHDGSHSVLKRTLVARSGNRFKLDRPLRENLWLMADATAATLFPILSGENIHSVVIEDLVLDGNKANNENLDGNYAGCIFLQDCNDITIRKVEARHYKWRRHQLADLPRCPG
jgi:hypothetical protein